MFLVRIFLISALFLVFAKYFGKPSYDTYMKKSILNTRVTETQTEIEPPGLYLCVNDNNTAWKWNENERGLENLVKEMCKEDKTIEDLEKCIEKYSYTNEDMFIKADDGKGTDTLPFWKDELTYTGIGKCKTLNGSYHIGFDITKAFHLELKTNHSYMIMMHDPHFFSTTPNPRTMPRIYRVINEIGNFWLYIEKIDHIHMNTPKHPCQESRAYSFTACIRNHLSTKVGCRLKWDTWSDPSHPLCSKVEQVFEYETEFFMMSNYEQSQLVNATSCPLPCHYREYRQLDRPVKGFKPEVSGLDMMFASASVVTETEELVYPMISFVAEFGGSLGLFLGFSFMLVADVLEAFIAKLIEKYQNNSLVLQSK